MMSTLILEELFRCFSLFSTILLLSCVVSPFHSLTIFSKFQYSVVFYLPSLHSPNDFPNYFVNIAICERKTKFECFISLLEE